MAYTLAQLRTLVLQRADMENTTFITNTSVSTELSQYIRDSAASLHDKLIALLGADFDWGIDSIATVAGTDTYALDSAFYRLIRVDLIDGDYAHPLERWNRAEGVRDTAQRSWTGEVRPRYALLYTRGGSASILFTPKPDAVHSLEVWHHNKPPALAADADSTGHDHDEWIILDAAIKCRAKEESDTTTLERMRDAYEARLVAWARQPDQYKPANIIDARLTENDDWVR